MIRILLKSSLPVSVCFKYFSCFLLAAAGPIPWCFDTFLICVQGETELVLIFYIRISSFPTDIWQAIFSPKCFRLLWQEANGCSCMGLFLCPLLLPWSTCLIFMPKPCCVCDYHHKVKLGVMMPPTLFFLLRIVCVFWVFCVAIYF